MTPTLGFGFYAGVPGWALPYTDGWQLLMDPSEHNPFGHSRVIGRVAPGGPGGDEWEKAFIARGFEAGVAYGQFCQATWDKARWINLWVGPNEPSANTVADAQALSAFYQGFAAYAHNHGRKVAGPCFSRGRPDEHTLAEYVPLAAAVDALAFHEYGLGDLRNPADFSWHAFRYRRLTSLLKARGIRRPIFITELGLDNDRGGGWRSFGVSPAEFLAQLEWYAREAAKDADVQGLMLFAGSAYGWESFLVDEEIARGVERINWDLQSVAAPAPAPAPVPAPKPATPAPQPIPQATVQFPRLMWPVRDAKGAVGRISQIFGARPEYYRQFKQANGQPFAGHNGIDIAVTGYSPNTPPMIVSPMPGEVWAYDDPGYGHAIEIWYPNRKVGEFKLIFAHLKDRTVRDRDMVKAGQIIGHMGWSGNCQPAGVLGAHLHYGTKPLRGGAINPGFAGWVDPAFWMER